LAKKAQSIWPPTLALTPHKPSFCAHTCLTLLSSVSCIPVFVDVDTTDHYCNVPRPAGRALAQRAAYNI